MPQKWTKALKGSISEVFSTMFFMVLEQDPEILAANRAKPAQDWMEGRLEVTREGQTVQIWVWAPPQASQELAANLLSSDPSELSADELLDAFREMLNMVSGSVLTAVDVEGEWKMGLPQAHRLDQGDLGQAWSQAQELLGMAWDDVPVTAGVTVTPG
jgi:hypothetical protein